MPRAVPGPDFSPSMFQVSMRRTAVSLSIHSFLMHHAITDNLRADFDSGLNWLTSDDRIWFGSGFGMLAANHRCAHTEMRNPATLLE